MNNQRDEAFKALNCLYICVSEPIARDVNKKVFSYIDSIEGNYQKLLNTFKHIHVNCGIPGDDSCKKCGLDLRDEIHNRI